MPFLTQNDYEFLIKRQIKTPQYKYRNRPSYIDSHFFASQKEAERYKSLKLAQQQGIIRELELQPKFELQPAFERDNQEYRSIIYQADFKYWDMSKGEWIVEDVKGFVNQVFKLKLRLFLYKYPRFTFHII